MSDLVWNDAELRRILSSPAGAVAVDLARRAIRVESRAKQLCPVDTGRLRSSITWRIIYSGGALDALVGTNVEYAIFVHEGTRPHVIRGNPWLYWPGAAHPVRQVNHPGTRAHRFLVDALPAAA
jgi:hypothetical protein